MQPNNDLKLSIEVILNFYEGKKEGGIIINEWKKKIDMAEKQMAREMTEIQAKLNNLKAQKNVLKKWTFVQNNSGEMVQFCSNINWLNQFLLTKKANNTQQEGSDSDM